MEFQVRLTDEAIADLRGIVQLIAEKSPEAARRLLTGFIVATYGEFSLFIR